MESQVVFLADTLERLIDRREFILHQDQQLISRISSLSGKSLHPEVIDLFLSISSREEFWLDLMSPRLYSILLHKGPLKNELGRVIFHLQKTETINSRIGLEKLLDASLMVNPEKTFEILGSCDNEAQELAKNIKEIM